MAYGLLVTLFLAAIFASGVYSITLFYIEVVIIVASFIALVAHILFPISTLKKGFATLLTIIICFLISVSAAFEGPIAVPDEIMNVPNISEQGKKKDPKDYMKQNKVLAQN